MKNRKFIISLPLVALLATGCVGSKHYASFDYVIPLEWKEPETHDFRVLQLGDIHFSQSDVFEQHFKIIDKTVETANPDLIVLNGDSFTFADKHVVNKLFSHINSYGVPWTFTFGNHDDQGYYNDTYISRLLAGDTYENAKYIFLKDDDVTGRSNFVISLRQNNAPVYNVFVLESHCVNYEYNGYDFLKQDQIDWFERISKDTAKGKFLPSSAYLHISPPEFFTAAKNPDKYQVLIGSTDEFGGGPNPSYELGFFAKAKECGLKSMHCAHDHINDSVILYEDVYLAFGVHATDRIYGDDAKIGGQVLIIDHETQDLNFENIYVDKNTLEVNTIYAKEAK